MALTAFAMSSSAVHTLLHLGSVHKDNLVRIRPCEHWGARWCWMLADQFR